ncbi:MAG: hypothetical protein ACJA1C_002164 [Crocinitomicaceae bacterium]|jgi:hypothetical protein
MGISVNQEPCSYCSQTGYCGKCLGDGFVFDDKKGSIECTQCSFQAIGKCMHCHGLTYRETISRTDDKEDINLDFEP